MAFLAYPHFLAASTLTTLVSFTGTNGAQPPARLVQGSDGNFYGTTYKGGSSNDGTVFQLTPKGTLTTLVSFDTTNGGFPQAGLIQGSDGNFYGTTTIGTAFQITSGGTLTTLAHFNLGADPFAGLIQNSDGNFYGTTYFGGSSNSGIIFKLTPGATLTTLVNFNFTNGSGPNAGGLILGADGNFYGTTEGGGSSGYGTIFKLTGSNTLTALANFNSTNGANPAGLIQGSDGNFYGTTKAGGSSNNGTVFQLTPGGTLTTLVNFNSTNGADPEAPLIQGSDGNFYGTTFSGGSAHKGTVFQLVHVFGTVFNLNTLVNFNSTNGANPQAGLIQGSDGNFYGTTYAGGSANTGTLFRYEPTTSEHVTFSSVSTIPIVASAYSTTGSALNLTLNYAPSPGDVLTVVQNTGSSPINGTFTNLPNGGFITATFNGMIYTFVANYAGGDGNDLTLTLASGFNQWAGHYFNDQQLNNPTVGGPTGIPENDRTPNLLKYIFNINPIITMSVSDRAALPVVGIDATTTPGTQYLEITYRQNPSASGITVNLQTSTDLVNWTTANPPDLSQQVGTDSTTGDPIKELGVKMTGQPRLFIRLNVSMP